MNYTLKRHQSITLTDERGKSIRADRIGKGNYCEAFRAGSSVYLLAPEDDYAKEIACEFSSNRHLPRCERLGYCGERTVYRMPFYRTVAAKDSKAWAQFKALQAAREEAWVEQFDYTDRYFSYGHAVMIATADRLDGALSSAVREIADACANYGASWTIEVAKRNCGVSKSGNLVLRDAWFDLAAVHRQMEAARKRAMVRR